MVIEMVPWAEPKVGFTRDFEDHVAYLAQQASWNEGTAELPAPWHAPQQRSLQMVLATFVQTPKHYTPAPASLGAAFAIRSPFLHARVEDIKSWQAAALGAAALGVIFLIARR
jgi:hypothetical protein